MSTLVTHDPSADSGSTARVGLWILGARGSVATTAATGLLALAGGLVEPLGCVTAGPDFAAVPLPGYDDIVVGGHDVVDTPLVKKAELLAQGGVIPAQLVAAVADDLAAVDAEIRPGYDPSRREAQGPAADRMAADIRRFQQRHDLATVVVIDLTSTEPLPPAAPELTDAAALTAALGDPDRRPLQASSVGALAAIRAGSPFIGFTPSAGLAVPVLREWAQAAGIPFAGQDGKTGQTLLRSVLAPMFVARGMRVLSWAGTNLLGGGDGATLADPQAVQSKLVSKNRGLQDLIGTDAPTPLHIDNVPDLGDVKTAWDHVYAQGFLGSRITLQTTWSAPDSALAAPLVLDLARLMALAATRGCRGAIGELGFFFKDPWGSDVHAFADQTAALLAWAGALGSRT